MEATLLHRPDVADVSIDLDVLGGSLVGRLVTPADEDYDTLREVHLAQVDARPVAIVRAADARDVARTVLFARDSGLELAVRGGGHSVAGHSTVDGGLVLDLRDMRGLHIDPEARIAWAQPGLTAIEVTEAAAAHGLAIPFGDSGSVGIAGLTLGGGIGWLVRKHGLTIDSLLAVELVTADGRQVAASETENADLFWAIRGGGGNFGVVTRFQFRLSPVGMVFGGALLMPATADVLRSLVPIAASAPRELTTITFFMGAVPPMPFIAPEHFGKPGIAIMFVYDGDPESGAAAIAPFRAVATPLGEMVTPMPYPAIYQFTADASQRANGLIRSAFFDSLDGEAVATILDAMADQPQDAMTFTQIRVLGGAMSDVPADASAFAHRGRNVMVGIHAMYQGDGAAATVWADTFYAALAPKARGVYSNFLGDEGDGRVREAYPAATWERLVDVKRRFDPTNLFRRNQNISPR